MTARHAMKRAIATTRDGVETASGFIPHVRLRLAGVSFDAPVRLWPHVRVKSAYGVEEPIAERTNDGRLVYALPGGGWVAR